jgi:hypothetical protein
MFNFTPIHQVQGSIIIIITTFKNSIGWPTGLGSVRDVAGAGRTMFVCTVSSVGSSVPTLSVPALSTAVNNQSNVKRAYKV